MAVRTEKHAFRQLGFDPRPAAQNPVGRDRENLRRRIDVMELEYTRRDSGTASRAERPQLLDRPQLALPAKRDLGGFVGPRSRQVPGPVTVRAEQVALRRFFEQSPT